MQRKYFFNSQKKHYFVSITSHSVMKKFVVIFILFNIFLNVSNYAQERKVIQLSGIVRNDSLKALAFAHVIVKGIGRGTITNSLGDYSLATYTGDTIIFSCLGHKRKTFIVPKKVKGYQYSINPVLKIDPVMLGEALVLPWSDYQEFKQEVLSMKLPEDEYKRAVDNINYIVERAKLEPYRMTPSAAFRNQMQDINYRKTRGTPTINLLGISKLIQAIQNGEIKFGKEAKD